MEDTNPTMERGESPLDSRLLLTLGAVAAFFAAACWYGL
jgi:hypothetical protein